MRRPIHWTTHGILNNIALVKPAQRTLSDGPIDQGGGSTVEVRPAPALSDDLEAAGSLAPAVTRAAAILDVLAESPAVPSGPSELARRLGLPKSSIANILNAMADGGLVRRSGSGFTLGRKLAELGGAYLAAIDLVQEFYDASRELPRASDETVQLAVLDNLDMTYLARHDGRQQVRLTSGIGRRLPATVTATGKAALASLDDRELDRRLAKVTRLPLLTPNSIKTVDALRADIARVRQRGHAIDDEETVEGVICLGVAIPSRRPGEGPYAASVTLLKARATDDRVEALVEDLRLLASRLSDPMRVAARRDGHGSRIQPTDQASR
jgi:IclR family transcriptional regulator, blcABC operon repressor